MTAQEINNPKKYIKLWPTPGAVRQRLVEKYDGIIAPDYLPFITYINSWFYRELSGQTHGDYNALSEKGLFLSRLIAKQIAAFFATEREADERQNILLETLRHNQIYICITLMLSIVSEIEIHFGFGLAPRIKILWAILSDNSDVVKEIYEFRYLQKLP